MELQIAICDDLAVDRDLVAAMVRRWAEMTGNVVTVRCFPSAESFLFHYADHADYDILLLDVEMGDMDGVTMAKKLRQTNEAVQIVFITGYSDYIAEGYEVSALHYLIKPVQEAKLFSVLSRAADKCRENERFIALEHDGQLIRVPLYQIRYADVQANYVTVHCRSDFTVKMTLSQLEKELDDRFYRVGRSAIVNLHQISRVTRADIYLRDGSVIPLPRGAYEGVNRAIIGMR